MWLSSDYKLKNWKVIDTLNASIELVCILWSYVKMNYLFRLAGQPHMGKVFNSAFVKA